MLSPVAALTLLVTHFSLASAAVVQGNCTSNDRGLRWLSTVLSNSSIISCRGEPYQLYNADRYWGEQYGKNASVVVFPFTTKDVSYAVQATNRSPLGADYAFVCGAHSMTNSSSSYDFVIDLSFLNYTRLLHNFTTCANGTNSSITAVAYGGGATTLQVQEALNGTGFTAITARASSVGMGGFSTGGGIGFIAGAYGYATDRLMALEVVLPSGDIVFATKENKYSDLFWSFQGGAGQMGIVTTFYQEAAPTPTVVKFGFHIVSNDSIARSYQNTVDFFNQHNDPFSLMYYGITYIPKDLTDPSPMPEDYVVTNLIVTVWFGDPTPLGATQPSYDTTFSSLLSGLNITGGTEFAIPYANLTIVSDVYFPYGLRRGFWGPQATNVSVPFFHSAQKAFSGYISDIRARGDFPASTTWVMQYMSPGLNGHAPTSDAATAWPHQIPGHQTLFDPGWSLATNDALTNQYNDVFNNITYAQQESIIAASNATVPANGACGGLKLCDYPNYIGPDVPGKQVWGNNIPRLTRIKQKYDPECRIHNGRVFASRGCIERGLANVFP